MAIPVVRLAQVETRLNVLSYGPPGTGKTTGALSLASQGRILLIDVEAGAKAPALRARGVNVENIDIWPSNPADVTFAGIEELYMELRAECPYAGIVVDSMTELSRRLLEDIVEAAVAKAQRLGKPRDSFQINLEDYGVLSTQMRIILRRFRDLNTHLVLTALERRDVDDDGSVAYGPALGPAVGNDAMGLVDVIVYHSIEDVGSESFYTGTTSPRNRRRAKDRFGVLPGRLVDPTAERILGYVEGTLTKVTDPRQEAARRAAGKTAAAAVARATEAATERATTTEDGVAGDGEAQ